jgi:hypothetical protein
MTVAKTPEDRFQTVDVERIRCADSEDSDGLAVLPTSPRAESVYALGTPPIVAPDAELPR